MNRKISRFTVSLCILFITGYVSAQSINADSGSMFSDLSFNNSAEVSSPEMALGSGKLKKNSKKTIAAENNSFRKTPSPDVKDIKNLRLKHKIIPLANTVYQLIDYFEAKGLTGFLPMAKPYTKEYIAELLVRLLEIEHLKEWERNRIAEYLSDITNNTNGLAIIQKEEKNTYTLGGFSAETSVRNGMGDHGTWSASLIGEPYLSGDLGEHITYTAAMGLAVERLTPDLFYQSYTKNSKVVFPNEAIGYSYLPYQFNFETMWAHVKADASSGEGGPVKDNLTAGMIYHTEVNGSWLNGLVQFSLNNQRRAWGHEQGNLVLSNTARRFPGIELKIHPAKWIRYSYLTGSLFSYANQRSNYRRDIYGYDLGQVQKNFTYHLLEIMPTNWLQISGGGGNVWSKRLEIAYLMPFVLPHFTQIDVGDHDNLTLYFDVATQIPVIGKTWLGFFVDEFSFTKGRSLLKMPRNRYAWQLGWKTNLISGMIPGTTSTLKYTRLTPFVYTHYPETDFNTFGSDRPLDMTYTHDEFNLGFYLPPNSGEINWKLENIAVKDLTLSLENRLIIHGTNDLASSNIYQIYGDVYRHQLEGPDNDIYEYPLLNFTKDGIYDWTAMTEFKFDWKMRKSGLLNYYRLVGSFGYSNTWWKSNESGVIAPESKSLFTGSLGIVVEM
ncbi:MAG: hypothetical protein WAO52_18515 [Prolixibacteraceae bacterium]